MNENVKAIKELQGLIRQCNADCRKEISVIQTKNRITIGRLNREINEIKQDLSAEELELVHERKIAV